MNDNDYIRKAVELADGWSISHNIVYPPTQHLAMSIHHTSTWILDALAAQLVRQVDATGEQYVASTHSYVAVRGRGRCRSHIEYDDNDRTMNTIKAIVDSGVLK